jgi:N-acetylneuraminic acid mutarotase
VERYDPGSDTWTAVASMKRGRKLPGVVAINQGPRHLIVVIGGETPEIGRLRTTEVYDVNTGQWHLLRALLPSATVSLVAATEADGTVLAVGGNAINFDEPTATDKVFALKVADHNS